MNISNMYLKEMCSMTEYNSPTASVYWDVMDEFDKDPTRDYSILYEHFYDMCGRPDRYKSWTEIVLLFNWRSWYYNDLGYSKLCEIYTNLFKRADDAAFKLFQDNEEAMTYFLRTTD